MHAEDDMLASAHIARSDTTRWRERVGSGPREPQGTLVMISVPALMINDRLRRWRPVPAIDGLEMKSRVDEILNRHPAVGFALGVVRNGSLEFLHTRPRGPGVDQARRRRHLFRIASITKTFTAIAVMQLWEQGLVELDAPANDYLRAYQLVPAKRQLAACHSATPADAHRRHPRAGAPLRHTPYGLRGECEAGTADALPQRVLPRWAPPLR